tara:strand:- start:437 stop:655 length:219 start_codon:yes stop_codon:yes gene_type:complete
MKALAHNIKNIFIKLLGANKCCRNKQSKPNKHDMTTEAQDKRKRSATTPIYRNKHGYPEDICEFGRDDKNCT